LFFDLPHPGLLPKEKEKRFRVFEHTSDGIGRTVIRKTGNIRWPFLLLGGEG
jgi:hypothetical protein